MKDFSGDLRPERPFLSAQAEGLGTATVAEAALKGPFSRGDTMNDPFRVKSLFRPFSQAFGLG